MLPPQGCSQLNPNCGKLHRKPLSLSFFFFKGGGVLLRKGGRTRGLKKYLRDVSNQLYTDLIWILIKTNYSKLLLIK